MNKQNLIENIIKIRKEKGLTQADLAQRTGISQQVLSRVENENSNPKLNTLVEIANAMNCRIDIIDRDKNSKDACFKTKREWQNAKLHLIEHKEYIQRQINDLRERIRKHPNSDFMSRMRMSRLANFEKSIEELNSKIENYKTGTVVELYKNIKKDSEDFETDINEFEQLIHNFQESVEEIKENIYISWDFFDCIEANKDFISMFEDKKKIIDVEVIKEIHDVFAVAQDEIDTLYSAVNDAENNLSEIIQWLEEYL